METSQAIDKFLFFANQPALDFINTEIMAEGKRVSLIANFADLLDWLMESSLLDQETATNAKRQWGETEQAEGVLVQALDLRAQIREMAEEIAERKPISASGLSAINALLRQRQGYEEVIAEGDHYHKQFRFTPTQPEHLLIPIAEAAADLLCNTDFSLVRRCENPACILYFYDTTKNHARRWCSMGLCGNRLKQAAHYRRTQKQKEQSSGIL